MKLYTDPDELTYKELVTFKQFFMQILYNFDTTNVDEVFAKVYKLLDEQKPIEASFTLRNFQQSLQLQEIGVDAWQYCFALLVENRPINPNEKQLKEIFADLKPQPKEKEIQEAVVNFTKAFPMIYMLYQMKSERLNTITDLFLNQNL